MSKGTSEDLQRCRQHLKECLGHPKCINAAKKAGNRIAPKRLLDVREHANARLHRISPGEHPRYVALSYCWGDTQPEQVKTTKANLQSRHDVTNLSGFPQTIRDAIHVCCSLGFHYMWIDALCIVQDDDDEKASEIAKMQSIYRGAALTIGAASAANSTDGFLQDRTFEEAYSELFRIPYYHKQDDHTTEGYLFLSELPISDEYQEPLDKRGWTMQEDMLSLRLLRFGSKQTTWRCPTYAEGINIDGGSCPIRTNIDPAFDVHDPSRNAEVRSRMLKDGALALSNVYGSWQRNIERYTLRKLSTSSDRLPACAALAENFGEIMGLQSSDYLAGSWKPDLMVQLLWYRLKLPDIPVIDSPTCLGPTWSWASLNAPVLFFERHLTQSNLTVEAKAEYIDSQIKHRFERSPYAEVESGRLVLRGRLQQACWTVFGLVGHVASLEILPVDITWDIPGDAHPEDVWCFEVIGSYRTLGLILVGKGQEAFERVGYFECSAGKEHALIQQWFHKNEPKIISIE
ncbi:unnamed protein product [Alternaria alternata]